MKNKRYEALDLENLIEELEDLGNEKRFRVASLLEQIIRHALLLQFWTEKRAYNQAHWQAELVNFQYQLNLSLIHN